MPIKLNHLHQAAYNICYLDPKQLPDIIKDNEFEGSRTRTGSYYFIQINKDVKINKGTVNQEFKAKTIFFLCHKEGDTAHRFLAKYLLGLEDDKLLTAGELFFNEGKLASWNLKSGGYWRELKLDSIDVAKLVGLPMEYFTKVDDVPPCFEREYSVNEVIIPKVQSQTSFQMFSQSKASESCSLQDKKDTTDTSNRCHFRCSIL